MKTITIPDLHGHDSWKKIAEKADQYDKIIFLGDYVDSFSKTNDEIKNNLIEIIEFKQKNMGKVVLLLGNHELPYLYFPDPERYYMCEGYRPDAQPDLTEILNRYRQLFQVAYQHGIYLWTHAGVSKTWYYGAYLKKLDDAPDYMKEFINEASLEEQFNCINETALRKVLHQISGIRIKYGPGDSIGGITWADKVETCNDFLPTYHQIVGHTPVHRLTTIISASGNESITYTDCLHSYEEFYELEIK